MNNRRTQQLIQKAAPLMQPGEKPELGLLVKLNPMSTAGKTAMAVAGSVALVAAGAAGGFVGVSSRPRYVLLTDRQLMVFDVAPVTNGPGRHLGSYSRERLTAWPVRRSGVLLKMRLDVAGLNKALMVVAAPLPPVGQRRLRELATALGAVEIAA
jgi:hypothetical protein